MKLANISEFINHWPTSLAPLKELVIDYFHKKNLRDDNLWFPDIEIVMPERLQKENDIQVILFGGFLERIFESGFWPDKNYHFFCLSERVKEIMTGLLHFPADSVEVISRYDLIPKPQIEKQIDLNSPLEIVYSGRFSSQKNIEMFLAFSSILQQQLSTDITIKLLGSWDTQFPKNKGRYLISSYEETIMSFQKQLSFKNSPLYLQNLAHHEWMNQLSPNSLLVNFSTYVCEDFGLSLAMTQEKGFPMLLSRWGGHADISGTNIHFLETNEIAESFSAPEKIILLAQNAVEKFLSGKLLSPSVSPTSSVTKLHFLNLSELQKLRLIAMEKHGHEIWLLGQDRMSLYASSSKGQEFFKEFAKIFGKKV